MARCPDATLAEHRAWAQAGLDISLSTNAMWKRLRKLKLTLKKSAWLPPSRRAQPSPKHAGYGPPSLKGKLDARRLVFLDETRTKTNMTRRHGRAPQGQRLIGRAPYGHRETTTFIAGLRHDRIEAPMVLDGPINGRAFRAYVEQFLAPTLQPGAS